MSGLMSALVRTSRKGPAVTGPLRASWRHKPTFFGKMAMERWIALGRAMPIDLKTLASLRASAMVGCVW